MALETLFFLVAGYRDIEFIIFCVLANITTNLTLNLILPALWLLDVDVSIAVYPLELLAVAAEYFIFSVVKGRSKKLLILVFSANFLSYAAGLLIYGHV